jgi:short-subunit dehydrogenase
METDLAAAQANIRTNFEGPALLLLLFADGFAKRGSGTLIGISSVAGDRGRASNYIYGSSKAGFSQFLSGLRARLRGKGVHVVTVKPGFVRTAMTSGMKLPPLLTAEPHEVADAVFARGQNGGASVIYVRRIWQLIMFIIRALPEPLFVRLGL